MSFLFFFFACKNLFCKSQTTKWACIWDSRGTLEKPENRDPIGTSEKPENRDPRGTLEKPENCDPSGTLEKLENWDPGP